MPRYRVETLGLDAKGKLFVEQKEDIETIRPATALERYDDTPITGAGKRLLRYSGNSRVVFGDVIQGQWEVLKQDYLPHIHLKPKGSFSDW